MIENCVFVKSISIWSIKEQKRLCKYESVRRKFGKIIFINLNVNTV